MDYLERNLNSFIPVLRIHQIPCQHIRQTLFSSFSLAHPSRTWCPSYITCRSICRDDEGLWLGAFRWPLYLVGAGRPDTWSPSWTLSDQYPRWSGVVRAGQSSSWSSSRVLTNPSHRRYRENRYGALNHYNHLMSWRSCTYCEDVNKISKNKCLWFHLLYA